MAWLGAAIRSTHAYTFVRFPHLKNKTKRFARIAIRYDVTILHDTIRDMKNKREKRAVSCSGGFQAWAKQKYTKKWVKEIKGKGNAFGR